jgi:hypothetical protein
MTRFIGSSLGPPGAGLALEFSDIRRLGRILREIAGGRLELGHAAIDRPACGV